MYYLSSWFGPLERIMLNTTTEFHLLENLTFSDFANSSIDHDVIEKCFYFTIKIIETFQTDISNALKGLFFYLFLLVFGNAALRILILYEKEGMDPQKRTINNQLLSKMCLILIWRNVFLSLGVVAMSPFFWNIDLGIYFNISVENNCFCASLLIIWHYFFLFHYKGDFFAIIIFYGEVFVFSYLISSLLEMVIIKCLLMYKWSQMSMIDDYLIANLLHRINLLFSGILTFPRVSLAEYMTNLKFMRLSKSFDVQNFHNPIKQWHPLIRFW